MIEWIALRWINVFRQNMVDFPNLQQRLIRISSNLARTIRKMILKAEAYGLISYKDHCFTKYHMD